MNIFPFWQNFKNSVIV